MCITAKGQDYVRLLLKHVSRTPFGEDNLLLANLLGLCESNMQYVMYHIAAKVKMVGWILFYERDHSYDLYDTVNYHNIVYSGGYAM